MTRAPSGDHSGWNTDSAGPPAMVRGAPSVPSSRKSARYSVVPFHGMLGKSQASQTSLRAVGRQARRGEEIVAADQDASRLGAGPLEVDRDDRVAG